MNDLEGSRRGAGSEAGAYTAPVRPVARGGGLPLPPRTLAVALLVGTLSFLVGIQVGPSSGTSPGATTAASTPSESPTSRPAEASVSPDRSRFAASFDASSLLSDAGWVGCPGNGSAGSSAGRSYEIFSARCAAPVAQQSQLVVQLEDAITMAVRSRATSRDAGLSGADDPAGSAVMSWDYSSSGFDGSIYLVATHVGSALHVVLILTEELQV